jgi:hypothetical protein
LKRGAWMTLVGSEEAVVDVEDEEWEAEGNEEKETRAPRRREWPSGIAVIMGGRRPDPPSLRNALFDAFWEKTSGETRYRSSVSSLRRMDRSMRGGLERGMCFAFAVVEVVTDFGWVGVGGGFDAGVGPGVTSTCSPSSITSPSWTPSEVVRFQNGTYIVV